MLKALELENFKAFGSRTRIKFAPITLIYGENSAGKSSVLNALNLLKQTRMSRDQSALLLPRAEGGLVDLGSFYELLHDHDTSRVLKIKLDIGTGATAQRVIPETEDNPQDVGFEIAFKREHDRRDISLDSLRLYRGPSTRPAMQFSLRETSEREVSEIRRYSTYAYARASRRNLQEAKIATCSDITDAPEFWADDYIIASEHKSEIVKALNYLQDEILSKPEIQTRIFKESESKTVQIKEALEFYSSQFSLDSFISRRRQAELGSTVLLDGFIPLQPRLEGGVDYPESIALRLTRETRPKYRLFDAAESFVEAGRAVEFELNKLYPMGPYRRAPKRLYIYTGTTPMDVGYSGDLLPDLLYRKIHLLRETNEWMDRLHIGYQIEISPVGSSSNDLFEVRLKDTRRSSSSSIALPDVGFGISQILPFVVQTLASVERTISIEQPEVHVHPRLQADIADLLISGIQPRFGHRFIVETHSEHLILRLLRRIRETTDGELPPDVPPILPQQVSVVYLERGPAGACAHHLRIDEHGEFIDRWPQGFFEERSKELF